MKGLRNSNIQDFFDGNQWIIVRRKKTATSSNVILLDIPKMIIEKYAGFSKDGKVFPVPSNTVCNDSLKRISQLIDCLKEKKVTFHLVRHTFATLFLSGVAPLESLSKMLVLDCYDFSYQPQVDKRQIYDLASCRFIDQKHNVVFMGKPGVGKTHLAHAIELEAVKKGKRVLFIHTNEMVEKLYSSRADGSYAATIQ